MVTAREFMTEYVPYRDGGSFVDELEQGTSFQNARYVIDLPYAAKLYYGENISSSRESGSYSRGSINYTKRPHPKAGPYWDRRMMQDKAEELVRSINAFIRRGNG